jgi:hypothetical protein
MTVEQRIHYQILHRKPAGIEDLIDQAVKRQDPVRCSTPCCCPR